MSGDPELLARIRAGDAAALEALYDRHAPSMYAVALRILDNDHTSAGAALEAAFLGLWEGQLTPGSGTSPAVWLVRAARDAALALRPKMEIARRPGAPTPRQLVEDVFYGGNRVEEIARTYALPEAQVRDLLRSGMAELRGGAGIRP
jgi:hypothetical protein